MGIGKAGGRDVVMGLRELVTWESYGIGLEILDVGVMLTNGCTGVTETSDLLPSNCG